MTKCPGLHVEFILFNRKIWKFGGRCVNQLRAQTEETETVEHIFFKFLCDWNFILFEILQLFGFGKGDKTNKMEEN